MLAWGATLLEQLVALTAASKLFSKSKQQVVFQQQQVGLQQTLVNGLAACSNASVLVDNHAIRPLRISKI